MTEAERRAFLSEGARTGKLATVRADGRPHVAPIWFVLDGDDIVLTTEVSTVKGRNILRDGRVALCVDDEDPPFAYAMVEGVAEAAEAHPDLLRWATEIGGRYMGPAVAERYGRRNAVEGELLVRVRPTHFVAKADIAD